MTDIKDRLAYLSALSKGPELIWPHMSDVADAAIARIEELEADNARYRAALVRIAGWPSYRLPSAPDIACTELERKIVSDG